MPSASGNRAWAGPAPEQEQSQTSPSAGGAKKEERQNTCSTNGRRPDRAAGYVQNDHPRQLQARFATCTATTQGVWQKLIMVHIKSCKILSVAEHRGSRGQRHECLRRKQSQNVALLAHQRRSCGKKVSAQKDINEQRELTVGHQDDIDCCSADLKAEPGQADKQTERQRSARQRRRDSQSIFFVIGHSSNNEIADKFREKNLILFETWEVTTLIINIAYLGQHFFRGSSKTTGNFCRGMATASMNTREAWPQRKMK